MTLIGSPESGVSRSSYKSFTFDGTAGKGAIGNCTVFSITGAVHVVSIDAVCTTTVTVDAGTGTASLSLGVTNATTTFIAATTANTITSTNKHWKDTTPVANAAAQAAGQQDIVISQNVVAAVTSSGTQLVNGGVIQFRMVWFPVTSDGTVA